MKKAFFCLMLVFLSTVSAWTLKTGTYAVGGTNPQGSVYKGMAIVTRNGDNYNVTWEIGSRQVQTGVGIHRDWDGVFSVAYTDLVRGGIGIVSYKVDAFGELSGNWTSFDGSAQGTEHLIWMNY